MISVVPNEDNRFERFQVQPANTRYNFGNTLHDCIAETSHKSDDETLNICSRCKNNEFCKYKESVENQVQQCTDILSNESPLGIRFTCRFLKEEGMRCF
jgi:hypothetical protein